MLGAYQLAAMDAEVLIANGRHREAADVILAMFRLGRLLRQEPSMMTAMLEIIGTQLLVQTVWNGLTAEPGWDPETLEEIAHSLGQIDFIESYGSACHGERQFFNDALDRMIQDGVADIFLPLKTPKWARPVWHLYPQGWLYRNKLMANR